MIEQVISLLGAAMILSAYGAHQLKWLERESILYLLLNLFGATILAVVAARAHQAGLTAVEAAWALITLGALIRRLVSRGPAEEVLH